MITGIVFRRPDAVARNLERRKPDPFAPRRTVIIEIQTRMIHQDGQTAANQHHHKKEIEEVAVTDPERKPVRSSEVVGIYLGHRWNVRQAGQRQTQSRTREPRIEPPQRFRSEWKGESRCGSGGRLGSALPRCAASKEIISKFYGYARPKGISLSINGNKCRANRGLSQRRGSPHATVSNLCQNPFDSKLWSFA